jgi:hypothetical protein
MKLTQPFVKLPLRFSAERLAAEVRALPPSAWMPHPQGFVGNEAVPLVSPNGEMTNAFDGPMAPTEPLMACPYIMEIMREIGAVWGRSRLMGLAAGADVPAHVDVGYYWRTHIRVHIPVITNPAVEFTCGDQTVHMEAGECWIPDTFHRHTVRNGGSEQRIHLVLDTVGGERLWDLIEAAQTGSEAPLRPAGELPELAFEQVNAVPIMSPYELQYHLNHLIEHMVDDPRVPVLVKRLDRFAAGWTALWAKFGPDQRGLPEYRKLAAATHQEIAQMCGTSLLLDNGKTFLYFFERFVLANAVSRRLTEGAEQTVPHALKRTAA